MAPRCQRAPPALGNLWRGRGARGPSGPRGGASGARRKGCAADRIVHGRSWHHVQNDEQRGEALKQRKEAGLIPAEPGRRCGICDGAEWRWQHVQALFPRARQGLDYYPCAQSLHRVAQAHSGASVQAVAWVEAIMPRLSRGQVSFVRGAVRRRQAQSEEAAKAMANCWDSLNEHRGRTT